MTDWKYLNYEVCVFGCKTKKTNFNALESDKLLLKQTDKCIL